MASSRSIKLTRKEVLHRNFQFLGAFRLRVEASNATGLDERVFVWRRDPINPYTGDYVDTFFAIASPVDMEEFPPEAPDPAKAFPFFRTSYVELDLRATSQAEEVWNVIMQEVCALLDALDRLEELETTQEIWCGIPPESAGSDSSGGSASSDSSFGG